VTTAAGTCSRISSRPRRSTRTGSRPKLTLIAQTGEGNYLAQQIKDEDE
jgi:hypothetical protein